MNAFRIIGFGGRKYGRVAGARFLLELLGQLFMVIELFKAPVSLIELFILAWSERSFPPAQIRRQSCPRSLRLMV